MGSDDIAKAVKDARIAAGVAVCAFFMMGLLLIIDGRRNKWIADRVEEIRGLVGAFQQMAVAYARPAAAQAPGVGADPGDGGGTGGDGAAGVVADGAAGTGMDEAGGPAAAAANGWPARGAGLPGGPRGDA